MPLRPRPFPTIRYGRKRLLGFNPKTRCPDLRIADEGTIAVVVFWLPRSGTPSQISIKSSSGSNALDSAAISCVSRLRFAPATRSATVIRSTRGSRLPSGGPIKAMPMRRER